jgi:hypothetical protein
MAYNTYFKQEAVSKHTHSRTNTHIYIHHKVLLIDILHIQLLTSSYWLTTSPSSLSHVKGKAEYNVVIKDHADHVIPPPNWISTEDEPGWTARMRPLGWSLYRAHGELEVVVNIITILLLYYYFVTILPIRTRSKYNFVVTSIKMS